MSTTKRKRKPTKVTPEMAASVIQMWLGKAGTGAEIGKAHGITNKTVFTILENAGVRPRKRMPGRGHHVPRPRKAKASAPPILGTTPVVEASIVATVKPGLLSRLWSAIKG